MRHYLCAALAFMAAPAFALSDLEAMKLSGDLGSVLASEEACGLSYNQDAIAAFIAKEVPPERMDFANQLNTAVMGGTYWIKKMTQSQKTAHCASITQTARHYGFIK